MQCRTIANSHLILVLEIPGKIAGVLVAILGITLQGAVNDFLQLWRDAGVNLAWWLGIIQQTVIHDQEGIGAGKWHLARQHFVKYDAQGI